MTSRPGAMLPAVLAALLVIAGCASTSGPSGESRRKAAQLNARLGANYLQQGNLDLADEKLRKALRQDDDNVDAHTMFALLQMRLDKPDMARDHFREALSLAPDDPDVRNNYGTFLCEEGDHDAGIEQFLAAAGNGLYNTPEYAYANAGACAVDAGRLDEARGYLRQALEIQPRLNSALLELATLEYDRGRPAAARKYLERYHEHREPGPETLLLAARIERRLGNREASEDYGRRLLRHFPDSTAAERFLEER